MFSDGDDGHRHQHKKHKISAEDYTARSNELYKRNVFADIGHDLLEHDDTASHRHGGTTSKHSSTGSKHDHQHSSHHHSTSRDKHEHNKQLKVNSVYFPTHMIFYSMVPACCYWWEN